MWEDVDTDLIDEGLIEEKIYSILSKISERHAKVVMLRNGYDCTYKEIGELFKVSPSRIREIDLKGLRILRSRYEAEFLSLDIPWVNKIFVERAKERKKQEEERERWAREWHQKQVEKKIAEAAKRREREKLKIVDSEIPKPEAIVKPQIYRIPYYPPHFVKLLYTNQKKPYLHVDADYGSIHRDLDPVTYDRWLNYLLDREKDDVHVHMLEEYKKLQKLR